MPLAVRDISFLKCLSSALGAKYNVTDILSTQYVSVDARVNKISGVGM